MSSDNPPSDFTLSFDLPSLLFLLYGEHWTGATCSFSLSVFVAVKHL